MGRADAKSVQEVGERGGVANRCVVAVAGQRIGVAVARQVDRDELALRGEYGPERGPVPA
jgi:hypothetical protein